MNGRADRFGQDWAQLLGTKKAKGEKRPPPKAKKKRKPFWKGR